MIKPARYKSRAKAKRRAKRITKTALVSLAVFIFAGGCVFLANLDFWKIKEINIEGVQAIAPQDIEDIVSNEISGKILFLIPKSNILAVPLASINKSIKTSFPRTKDVSVRRTGLSKLGVSVVERVPFALWCSENGNPKCQLMDREGYVFAPANLSIEKTYIVFKDGSSAKPSGFQFIDSDKFDELKKFLDRLQSLNLPPKEVSISGEDVSVFITPQSKIMFSLDGNIEETLSNLQSVLSDPNLSLVSGGALNVSYIDLRFGNKVFYKLFEE